MNYHAYESPPKSWDEQDAYERELERVMDEILLFPRSYDDMVETARDLAEEFIADRAREDRVAREEARAEL